MKNTKNKRIVTALFVLWALLIAGGMAAILNYQNTPGVSAPLADWPAGSTLRPEQSGDTMVMIAHPRCPCTRASISELAKLMNQAGGRLTTHVVFIKPKGFPVEWEKTDLWSAAAEIPGVRVMVDHEGVEAERFQAATSGQSMLYNSEGKLLFSGGITAARGHEGDNTGHDAIISFLSNGEAQQSETAVFGCPLFAPNETAVKDDLE